MNQYQAYAVWSVVASSVIFAAIIVAVFRKYLVPAVAAGQHARNDLIAAAERQRDAAIADFAAARHEQETLENALADLRLRSHNEAQNERERILQEARKDGERVIRNAEAELGRARMNGMAAIRHSLLERTIQRARERAVQEMTAEIDSRLVVDFSEGLSRKGDSSLALSGNSHHGA